MEFIQIFETILCFYINRDNIVRILSVEFLGNALHVGLKVVPNVSITIIPINIANTGNCEWLPIILIDSLFL